MSRLRQIAHRLRHHVSGDSSEDGAADLEIDPEAWRHPLDTLGTVKRRSSSPIFAGARALYPWVSESDFGPDSDDEAKSTNGQAQDNGEDTEDDDNISNAEGDGKEGQEPEPEVKIDLTQPAPPPCFVCEWPGRLDQLLHRAYLLDKSRSAKYPDLKSRASLCPSCSLIVQCLEHAGYDKEDTTVHFLTNPTTPVGTFFEIAGDTSLPLQIYYQTDKGRRKVGSEILMNRIGVPVHAALSGDTSSKQSLFWARDALRTCWKSHKTCRGPRPGFLPTRLIDVRYLKKRRVLDLADRDRDDNRIRLVDTKDLKPEKTQYLALSHCWGDTPPLCCTTRETYNERKAEIAWDLLPKTFQDAVQVARELRFRYLWIDSICIIQRDAQDWRHESGKMFDVFANAALTLAAVQSANSAGGLFSKTEEGNEAFLSWLDYTTSLDTVEARLRGLEQDTVRRPLHIRRSLAQFHSWKSQDLPAASPLFTRAWAYQERLVSPRVLYFTEDELVWECFEGSYCECTGDSRATSPKQSHLRAVTNSDCHARWREIVTEFSRLNLTMEEDKFPAISAVAVQIQQTRQKEKYLAGLWSDSLVKDLLWRATDSSRGRPATQIAPSWSWASVKSEVDYAPYGIHPLAEVVLAECKYPAGEPAESPHAACVVAGTIALRGPLIEFRLLPRPSGSSRWFLEHAASQSKFRFFEDADPQLYLDEPVYGLAIAKNQPRDPKSFHGIVLRKSEEPNIYRRIGSLMAISIMPTATELAMTKVFEKFGVSESVVIE